MRKRDIDAAQAAQPPAQPAGVMFEIAAKLAESHKHRADDCGRLARAMLAATPPPQGEGERDAERKLAAFGAWAAQEFRRDLGDVDGGSAQDAMERCGVLVPVTVTEPCGDSCSCADYGEWPMQCYRYPDDVRAAIDRAATKGER